jgi:hypothetical protein
VNPVDDPESGIKVSYPKFQSAAGTYISYKDGIWSPTTETYDPDKLVVINIPVFKTHVIYGITASVKNHMGVVTKSLSTDSHARIKYGGLGSFMAEARMPDLTILDCIWILARPGEGPWSYYHTASRRDQLVASTDPVALDAWATKFIMVPQILENGFASYPDQDPDNPTGDFRSYLDNSMNELLLEGIDTTNDYNAVNLHVRGQVGPQDRDQQKCILELNKSFAKVARAQAKHLSKCIQDGSKGNLSGANPIETCLAAEDAKVNQAKQKLESRVDDRCVARTPGFGVILTSGPNVPPEIDTDRASEVAMERGWSLIRAIFGSDLDVVIDPSRPNSQAEGACQVEVDKQATKCQGRKLKEFSNCKKNGLRGMTDALKVPDPNDSPFDDPTDLELCLGFDPKGKIEKACLTSFVRRRLRRRGHAG